jgi:hypothetical protein
MGEGTMRITIVGAILIVAGIAIVALVLDVLLRKENGSAKPNNPQWPEGGQTGSLGV